MLRHLGGGAKGRIQPPARGTTSSTSTSDGPLRLKLNVPNYGILYLGPPDAPLPDGTTPNVPRDDPMLHGSLDIVLPEGTGARRCKSIRVGFKTVITLDLGTGRRYEEDVLFERKVEIISSTADGIWLSEGLQQ